MLPPNIAQLAAKTKAADSLSIRCVDVTLTLLEGALTEATMLVDERDELRVKLEASLSTLTTAVTVASERPAAEPVHFTMNGGASVCGRRAAQLPKGVAFTLAFDPDDDSIDCRDCRMYLQGLRAAAHAIAGSPR